MDIFLKLKWFFKKERKTYLIGITSLVVVSMLQIITPYVIGRVVDDIKNQVLTKERLMMWIGLILSVALTQYALRYIWRTNIWGGAARLEKTLRQRLFHHFTQMDTTFFQKYRTGDLMAHATNDLNAIQNVAGAGILTFADSLVNGGAVIVAMILFVDWRLTLIALLPLPLLAITSQKLGESLHDAFRESQESFSKINDKTQESITGIKVIKTFGQEKEDLASFQGEVDQAIVKINRVNFLDALLDPAITLIIGVSYVLTIIFGGKFIMEGSITIGQLITFIDYISMLVWPMFAIGRLFNVLQRGNASYDRVSELLGERSKIVEKTGSLAQPVKGDISYDIASFSYPNSQNHLALQQVHFSLPKGNTLGIVGKTGAGKTTLLKLLLREYDQYTGEIQFGQHNIKDYALDSLLASIGYVPQDHFLFSMSIRDNIRFASPKATEAQVEKVAKLTAIHEDILAMPEGYDTMVGERGVSLSGGQKQRISIARALLLEPELLILDDALSAVDAKTEEKILSNLKQERQNQTTIITAHRLSSVMHANEIIVIDEGRISERGNHDQLLKQAGWYNKMFNEQQLEAKIEGGVSNERG
ncbi:ABC transporter ATP-binding protein [Vagococcus humatus]|uniref:Multidrug ABC transporter permease/ATP-binding protein n=1 Tax=Vagococcus humatus TaxID=1889241 RepID=A0A3R9YE52_9ENTE|nr:ABC transporter transmembrane domain-containing protein [Vagococcus humatus]RST90211.1 multidrug ABC transporter permease/ATP-binding protein [Vagococcus humatus]